MTRRRSLGLAVLVTSVVIGLIVGLVVALHDTGTELTPAQLRVAEPEAPAGPVFGSDGVALTEVAELDAPVAMAAHPDGEAIYVAERAGRVRLIRRERIAGRVVPRLESSPALDISDQVSTQGEQGMLGLAVDPPGSNLYVSFTDVAGDSRVRRFALTARSVDEASGTDVIRIPQPSAYHNGGHIAFDAEGDLWLGLGDGGSRGDAFTYAEALQTAQDPGTLLGSLLRVRPLAEASDAYAIPPGNPYASEGGGRAEVWLYGLRQPWRFSFDRENDDLWLGDVGSQDWEEINFLPAPDRGRGANLGWGRMEGTHPFEGRAPPPGHQPPVFEYEHGPRACAVVGGFVYRGRWLPRLAGTYLFGDLCGTEVRTLEPGDDGEVTHSVLEDLGVIKVVSFGEDSDGEIYVLSLDGPVYRLDPA